MSRQSRRRSNNGPKLPFAMQQRLSLPDDKRQASRRAITNGYSNRKELRNEKSQYQDRNVANKRGSRGFDEEVFDTEDQGDSDEQSQKEEDFKQNAVSPSRLPRSILRKRKLSDVESDGGSDSEGSQILSRDLSPEIVLDAHSRTYKDRMAQNDAEIATLEKKLGMKKSNKRIASGDDFDDILNGLDANSEDELQGYEERDWLSKKRKQVEDSLQNGRSSITSLDGESDEDLDDLSGGSEDEDEGDQLSADEVALDSNKGSQDDSFNGFEEPISEAQKPQVSRIRENPYKAPVTANSTDKKYVPPSLRKLTDDDQQSLEKLRRQVQGQLNKLSEANLISILGEIEKIYQTNPRQDTTNVLVENILSAFSSRSSLQNTFIILHAAFLAAVYKVLGVDFGAELVCKLVARIDQFYQHSSDAGKETLNLISLLANLFTFNVVSSTIIYDHIRLLLNNFGENNAELLLRIIRDCGPQLRSDDPTALKEIVQMMHNVSAELTKQGQSVNVRTRVMMDTITDLKNNKIKQATNNAGVTGEHLNRMRKALGSLNNRQLRGTDPLRISRDDIANSEKVGKWWLIGASWKGDSKQSNDGLVKSNGDVDDSYDIDGDFDLEDTIDFSALARTYKMNNDVRRSIFVAIMSAEDGHDALSRISKLRLKRKQEPEIARVLLSCCRAEPQYNQYYAVLAKNVLRDRRYKMSFQIALWKFLEAIGEGAENDDENEEVGSSDEAVKLHEIVNIAKMYAFLISKTCVPLDAVKTMNIGFTKDQGTLFLELLLVSLLTQSNLSDDKLMQIFGRVDARLVKSLRYFMQKKVSKSDLVSDVDRKKLKLGCKVAFTAFEMVDALDKERLD